MPIYEYRCEKCGRVTQFLEKVGGRKDHVCGECGGKDLKKQFSSFSAKVAGDSSSTGASACPTGTCPLS